MATRLISGFEKSILASLMASAWAFSSIPRISSVMASDLPQKEAFGVGVIAVVEITCTAPETLFDCKAEGVNRIGASPASSASPVGKYCGNSVNSGAMVAVAPGVNARGVKFADGSVFCTMHALRKSISNRQRHIMKGRCR